MQRYDSIVDKFTRLPFDDLTVTACRKLAKALIGFFTDHDETALINLWREFQNPWAEYVTEHVMKRKPQVHELTQLNIQTIQC